MTTSNDQLSGRVNSQPIAASSSEDAPPSAAHRRAVCTGCGVRELCLPYGLPRADRGWTDRLVFARLKVSRGEDLCRAGNPFGAIYVIRSGFFKSERVLEDGRCQIMGFHMPGEILGVDGIDAGRYTCNAVALEDAEVCVIPLQRLEDLLQDMHALKRVFHQVLGREIVRGHGNMMLLGVMTAEQRLAAFLLNLLQRFESRGPTACAFELPMTREDIGSFLGLKLETVSRLFSKLRDSGLLAVEQRRIRILDPAGLGQIVAQRPVRAATRQHTPAGQLTGPMPISLTNPRRDTGPGMPQP